MKINYKKPELILIFVLLLASLLRLWQLGKIPPSLTPDEASLGYNAYSILKTGHDEYGKFLPVIFKSFGDYKPGIYVYLTIPSLVIFGLTEFAVRLPSALAGILSIYLIYLICSIWFEKRTALAATFIAAINPWLIYFSRGAWEANISLALTLWGIFFFIKSLKSSKYILFASLVFSLTLLTYQGAKLSTFLVLVILGAIYKKDIINIQKKYLILSVILGIIISAPIVVSLFNGQSERLTVFSIFSYKRPISEIQKYSDYFYYIFHSEPINYLRAILGRWFNVFSGKFLFFEGDSQNPVHTAPYQGVMLLSDLVFLPLGLFAILKNKIRKENLFFLFWLVSAPLSAAISRDTTNAVRSLNTAVPLIFISSLGLKYLLEKFKGYGYWGTSILIILAFLYFVDAYYVHVPVHNSSFWRYGYKEAMNFVLQNKGGYKEIVFEQSYNQPYIYYLFYSRYLTIVKLSSGENIKDVGLVSKIDNVSFEKIDWETVKNKKGTLVILSPITLPPNFNKDAKVIKEVKYFNGRDIAFEIVEIQ